MTSPYDMTISVATGLVANAITAAASRSRLFVSSVIASRKLRSKINQLDKLIVSNADSEPNIRSYLASNEAQKILASLAYLAVIDETDGLRTAELGAVFIEDSLRTCPRISQKYAEEVWDKLVKAFSFVIMEMKGRGQLDPEDIMAAAKLFGETRRDERTGNRVVVLQSSVLRRSDIKSDVQRIEAVHNGIDVIRARVAEARKFIELPHLREQHRVPIDDLYIPRHLVALEADGENRSQRWDQAERLPPRLVILGNPGVGKSTYVSQLLHRTAVSDNNASGGIVPLLLSLRDYDAAQEDRSFASWLANSIESVYQYPIQKSTIEDIFSLGLALVVFDGLDEIIDLSKRRNTAARIAHFCQQYPSCDVIVTSREVGYTSAALDPTLFIAVTLPEFSEEQITEYVGKWFTETSREGEDPQALAVNFRKESTYATELLPNPLMLSLLCSVYQYIGYIPENRPALYEECSRLLFYRWDKIRHIDASSWRENKLLSMVQELAGFFLRVQSAQGGIAERQLEKVIQNYLRDNVLSDSDEAEEQARDFIDYCSGRAWVISKIGTAKGERLYGFTHRTFMEYFAAKSLVRECSSAADLVQRLRSIIGNSQSAIVPEIALQVYEEQGAIGGADEFINLLLYNSKFGGVADRRYLWFGLRALQFVSVKPVTASRVLLSSIETWAEEADPHSPIPRMILAVAGDTGSNFRSTLSRMCTSALGGSEDPLVIVPAFKFATYALTLLRDEDPWFAVLQRVLDVYQQKLNVIIRKDPLYATRLLLQSEISLDQWLDCYEVSELIAIKIDGQVFAGASVQIVAKSLFDVPSKLNVVSEVVRKFTNVSPCDANMYSLWLDMVAAEISAAPGAYPRIFVSNVGIMLYLASLAAIEEEGGPDSIPRIIRRIIETWAGLDIVGVAATARESEDLARRIECCDSIFSALQRHRISVRVQRLIQNWVIYSDSFSSHA